MKVKVGNKRVVKFGDLNPGDCFIAHFGTVCIKAFKDAPEFRDREAFGVSLEKGNVFVFEDGTEVIPINLECAEV